MSDLDPLRAKIDAIDTELLRLLNERATVAKEIGTIKNRDGLPIYSPERENRVLRSLVERSNGPLTPEAIRAIYREIMSASLALEKDIAIACLGPAGSPSHQAAKSKFGSSVRYHFFADVAEVLAEVKSDKADCGVIPIDDPDHGLANQTLDQLAETEHLSVCAEIFLTSESNDDAHTAARFFVIGRNSNPPSGHDMTLLILRIEDKPGALVSALEPFKTLSINLSHFASRPASRGSQDIFFFVEAAGHTRDLQMVDLYQKLSKRCRAVKVLGSYPRSVA
ncbi:MAG: chorismate mutase [Terrimicrobiaceae bacterium]